MRGSLAQDVLTEDLHEAATLGAPEPARPPSGRGIGKYLYAYIFIAPAVILLCLLIFYPLANAVYLSMTRSSFIQPIPAFVGLDNYRDVLTSSTFWQVAVQSVEWTVGVVVVQFFVGMATALLLNQKIVGRALLRSLVIVPWVMPGIIGGILWKLMYDPYLGLVNKYLMALGIVHSYVPWLAQSGTVMVAVIFAAIWKGSPFSALMYMAAYQNVSKELLEAAQIDGANAWQRLIHVTIPEMAPTIRTTILLTTVFTFNYFDLIYIATGGGPGNSSHIFPTYIYHLAFVDVQYGLAATYGIIAVAILGAFSILYVRELNKTEAFEH